MGSLIIVPHQADLKGAGVKCDSLVVMVGTEDDGCYTPRYSHGGPRRIALVNKKQHTLVLHVSDDLLHC